ncbi:MAG: YwiC-like family protein [Verrucomicrobia bacterium]|nr:YwiC-like family protein [Verrucomicrobiota bacterium]
MPTVAAVNTNRTLARWHELVWPREHGSWSLALEPLAFGLLAAPSAAGACLAAAAVAGFFARRPLRTALGDALTERRAEAVAPLVVLGAVAAAGFAGAVAFGGTGWLVWLAPTLVAGAAFLHFDLRFEGRAEAAEVAGAAAFGCLPAALAALAGWSPAASFALAFMMLGRAVPTVLTVRAALRAARTGARRNGPALGAAALALAGSVVCRRAGVAPAIAVAALAVLGVRSFALLVWPAPPWRARTLGTIEAVLGVAFITAVALAWRPN